MWFSTVYLMSCRVVRGASVRLQLPGDDQGRRGADRGAQGQRHSSQETSRRAGPREVPVLPAHHHTAGTLINIQADYAAEITPPGGLHPLPGGRTTLTAATVTQFNRISTLPLIS